MTRVVSGHIVIGGGLASHAMSEPVRVLIVEDHAQEARRISSTADADALECLFAMAVALNAEDA
jgi:hypothetical protein